MENLKELSLGQIVTRNYRAADIFDKYNLDFCCKGKKSLTQACADKQLDADKIAAEIEATANLLSDRKEQFDNWQLDFLADYIENQHHAFVKDASEKLLFYTSKVADRHGDRHPELAEIELIFAEIAAEMQSHMFKEENILFPYIKSLAVAKRNMGDQPNATFGTVQNPINMMEDEHEHAGELLEKIRMLTNNYNFPADACNTYKVMYSKLHEFEKDLHQHIHLENNILFPKAIAMEKELQNNPNSTSTDSCSIPSSCSI